jgi:hypothetical protein
MVGRLLEGLLCVFVSREGRVSRGGEKGGGL